jgi:hypothetical protein
LTPCIFVDLMETGEIMNVPVLTLLVAAILSLATISLPGMTIVWGNPSGGNWSDSSNWKPKQIPGANDTAVVTNSGNYTVTLDIAANVGGLVLGANDGNTQTLAFNGQSFTLAGQAALNPGGMIDLSSGTFNGNTNSGGAIYSGTLTPSGGVLSGKFTFASNSVLNLNATNILSGLIVFTNYGTITWSNTDLYGNPALQIVNHGLWDAKTNNTFSEAAFNNYGTFRKSGGVYLGVVYTYFDTNAIFNNFGTVDVQSGLLQIENGSGSGTFNIATGTMIAFDPWDGNFTLTGNPTFSGGGGVEGLLQGNNAVIQGALSFYPGWFGRGYLSGSLTIASNATLNLIAGGAAPATFNGVSFTNYGTVNWNDTWLNGQSNAQIYNYGLWNAASNDVFGGVSGGTVFNNYGTFRKSGGPGFAFIPADTDLSGVAFNNLGTLDVQIGAVAIYAGTGSGTFNTASGAAISFDPDANFTLTGSPTFSGGGVVEGLLQGDNAVIQGALSFYPGGWYYSNISGRLTIASNATLNLIAGDVIPTTFKGALFTNYGTVVWDNTDLQCQTNPQIHNYGLWNVTSNNAFAGGNGGTVFNNYGTFRKSGGTGTIPGPNYSSFDNNTSFNNSGTVDLQIGELLVWGGSATGTFSISNGASIDLENYALSGNPTFVGSGFSGGSLIGSNAVLHGSMIFIYGSLSGALTLASNATINLDGNFGAPVFAGTLFTNYGIVNWDNTDLNGQANPQICNYGLWDAKANNNAFHGGSGGVTTFNNYGTFHKSGGASFLDNHTVFNNSGTADVQAGSLAIGGGYALAGGALNFGISSSTNFGVISFAGSAALAGTLSVNLANGYTPAISNSFALINYSSETGIFTPLNLPHLPPALAWQTNYGSTAFTLSLVAAPPLHLSPSPVSTLGGTNFSFSWNAVTGLTYQAQYTTNLASTNWLNLAGPIAGSNGVMSVSDVMGLNLQRFYRLVAQ